MIEVHDLTKRFGSVPVLRGVSFSVKKGEAISIIGSSGGGKSVLLKHLVGLLQPDTGEVRIAGKNLEKLTEREMMPVRRRFGMLFQSAALFDSMTVEENVAFVLTRERQLEPAKIAERVAHALELVGLSGTEKKRPAELSGGMRKRVGLARAVIYEPEILLYDEPTTGLDPIASDVIDKLIIRVVQKLKVTSIAVTHDMRSARRIGQRILMLHEGKIYADMKPDEIFNSQDPVIHPFINGISEFKEEGTL